MEKIFLMCTERSGSNFITKLLDGHSKICGPSTKHIMNPSLRNLHRYEPLSNELNWNEFISDILNLFNVDFSHWQASFCFKELKDSVKTGNVSELLNYFFEKETKINGKEICLIKENQIYEFFPFLQTFYTGNKFIYQVRDPRDVALSWKKSTSHKGGVVNSAIQWKKDQQQFLKCYNILQKQNDCILIKYEDLISDISNTLTSVLKFIGLKYENELLNYYKNELTNKNSKSQDSWKNLSKGVMSNNFKKFKDELSDIEIKIIEKITYHELILFGYESINNWSNLQDISQDDLNNFANNESLSIDYSPSIGVKENMDAKKIFYQKSVNNE